MPGNFLAGGSAGFLGVQMRGLDTLSLRVKYMIRAAQAGLKEGVDQAAFIFEAAARQNSPVDTGANRDSIYTEELVRSLSGEVYQLKISPHMPYSKRLEYGFVGADSLGRVYHQQPRPYMRPAFDENKDDARQVIKETVLEAVQQAGLSAAARRASR